MEEIHYLIGNTCNLACKFCFWDMRIPDVSFEKKKMIINQIADTGIRKVTLSGGDPTCSDDFEAALQYMKSKDLDLILHTNGLRINEDMAERISKWTNRLSLSFDGSNEEVFYMMRKSRESFAHSLFLIDKFNELGIPVNVKTLVSSVNKDNILEIGEVLSNKPILYWTLMEFNPINRGEKYKDMFIMSDSEFDKLIDAVKSRFSNMDIRVNLFKRDSKPYCFISADGRVYTFIPDRGDILIGDLESESLSDLIKKVDEKNYV